MKIRKLRSLIVISFVLVTVLLFQNCGDGFKSANQDHSESSLSEPNEPNANEPPADSRTPTNPGVPEDPSDPSEPSDDPMNTAMWGDWSEWSECVDARQSRTRVCQNGSPGDPGCAGESVETQLCVSSKIKSLFLLYSELCSLYYDGSVKCPSGETSGLPPNIDKIAGGHANVQALLTTKDGKVYGMRLDYRSAPHRTAILYPYTNLTNQVKDVFVGHPDYNSTAYELRNPHAIWLKDGSVIQCESIDGSQYGDTCKPRYEVSDVISMHMGPRLIYSARALTRLGVIYHPDKVDGWRIHNDVSGLEAEVVAVGTDSALAYSKKTNTHFLLNIKYNPAVPFPEGGSYANFLNEPGYPQVKKYIEHGSRKCLLYDSSRLRCIMGPYNDPKVIDIPEGVLDVSHAFNYSCLLTYKGEVKCWGNLSYMDRNDPKYPDEFIYEPQLIHGF